MMNKSLFPAGYIGMPGIKGFVFRVDVDADCLPIRRKRRPLSQMERNTIKEHVDVMLKHGIISPTTSP